MCRFFVQGLIAIEKRKTCGKVESCSARGEV